MLNIATRDEGGVMIIDLEGQVDGGPPSQNVHDLIKENLEKGRKKFLINLTKVHWLNSLGAGILIAAFASVKRRDAAIKLYGITPRVDAVLRTCGLIPEVFEVYENEEKALQSFA